MKTHVRVQQKVATPSLVESGKTTEAKTTGKDSILQAYTVAAEI